MDSGENDVPDQSHEIATADSFYTRPDVAGGSPHRALRLSALRAVKSEPRPAALAYHLFGPQDIAPLPDDQIAGEVVAYINEARWVADCPDPRCNAAQVVTPNDARFLCAVCGNLANHRRWYRVKFPSANQRRAIEGLVSQRPNVENVNWTPDETVEQVRRLNREHGVSDEVR